MSEYFPASIDALPEIAAGLRDGTIEKWRHDGQRQWYKTSDPQILGIAPDAEIQGVDDDDDEEIEFSVDDEADDE